MGKTARLNSQLKSQLDENKRRRLIALEQFSRMNKLFPGDYIEVSNQEYATFFRQKHGKGAFVLFSIDDDKVDAGIFDRVYLPIAFCYRSLEIEVMKFVVDNYDENSSILITLKDPVSWEKIPIIGRDKNTDFLNQTFLMKKGWQKISERELVDLDFIQSGLNYFNCLKAEKLLAARNSLQNRFSPVNEITCPKGYAVVSFSTLAEIFYEKSGKGVLFFKLGRDNSLNANLRREMPITEGDIKYISVDTAIETGLCSSKIIDKCNFKDSFILCLHDGLGVFETLTGILKKTDSDIPKSMLPIGWQKTMDFRFTEKSALVLKKTKNLPAPKPEGFLSYKHK